MVRVVVPSMLAAQAEGQQRFSIDRGTLGEALQALPVADLIFNERGDLNRHLNVYVDGIDARELAGLSSSLADAREVRVVAMVSGG
jgi:molybdopterin synthase sulfur carrier subunit